MFLYLPVAGFLVTLFLLPRLPASAMAAVTGSSPVLLGVLALALVAVMYGVSIWCSVRTMEHKQL